VDSKRLDAQSGHEFTLTAIIPALAGANLIYGVGMLDSALRQRTDLGLCFSLSAK
jgi:trimethylamine--corrinoid protein Co-methyltransferase